MPEDYKANSTVRLPDPPSAVAIRAVIEAYAVAAKIIPFAEGQLDATLIAGIEIGLTLARDYPEAVAPVLAVIDNQAEREWNDPHPYSDNIEARAQSVALLGDAALGVNVPSNTLIPPESEFRWN